MRFSLADQLAHELRSLLRGYPDFVYSGEPPARQGHVPVFVYHTIRPSRFEEDLRYLQENDYRTIGMRALRKHLTGERQVPKRSVVLTFDDARSSFWRFGYPLLRRFEMKGVLFVIAGLTPAASSVRQNLFSVWEGEQTANEIRAIDPDDTTLCTWPELREMYNSGYVEIESHSLFHKEVFVDTEIVDFLDPDSSFVPYNTSATAYMSLEDAGQSIVPDELYGLPVFQSAPLHEGRRAWILSDDLIRFAKDQWTDLASEEIESGGWKRSLRSWWARRNYVSELRRQSPSEMRSGIVQDIARSRALIREHVDSGAGNHFCLPYTVGSEVSLRSMEKLGVESCSWGVLSEERHNTPGTTPMKISRTKSDFLWRLPGEGQNSLLRVYGKKIGRRLRGDRVF